MNKKIIFLSIILVFIIMVSSSSAINQKVSSKNINEEKVHSNTKKYVYSDDWFFGVTRLYVRNDNSLSFNFFIWIRISYFDVGSTTLKGEISEFGLGEHYSNYLYSSIKFPSLSVIKQKCEHDLNHKISLPILYATRD